MYIIHLQTAQALPPVAILSPAALSFTHSTPRWQIYMGDEGVSAAAVKC